MELNANIQNLGQVEYLKEIEESVKRFYNSSEFPKISFPKKDWKKLTKQGIMLSMIPKEFGGRDSHQELCEIIKRISLHNLPLGMYTMIITALFIRNVSKYGTEELKNEVLPKFSSEPLIGGFALTEPHCGSNLAKMTTVFEETEKNYLIKGEKHWQAFSLTADWWLVAAKNKNDDKDFAYFIVKRDEGWECFQEYEALGLKAIDYGRSKINATIPKYRRLNITSEKLLGAIDMLCASRLSMAAMASGFISNLKNLAVEKTKNRPMGNGKLYDVGYVKYKIKQISANKYITHSLFSHLTTKIDFRNDLLPNFFEAQAIKVLATDKMLESALIYQQLCGGDGYRYNAENNQAGYALLDARVYTIFDGTNDLLSQQLAEFCIKEAKVHPSLLEFLNKYNKTSKGLQTIVVDLSIINSYKTQEEKVMIGQIISRIFGLNCLYESFEEQKDKNIQYGDYKNTISFILADIKKLIIELESLQNNCLNCI